MFVANFDLTCIKLTLQAKSCWLNVEPMFEINYFKMLNQHWKKVKDANWVNVYILDVETTLRLWCQSHQLYFKCQINVEGTLTLQVKLMYCNVINHRWTLTMYWYLFANVKQTFVKQKSEYCSHHIVHILHNCNQISKSNRALCLLEKLNITDEIKFLLTAHSYERPKCLLIHCAFLSHGLVSSWSSEQYLMPLHSTYGLP